MSETVDLRQQKSEQTRERIVQTFLDMIPQKNWEKITVRELCAAAGISRGTFYQYFSDIYDLMEHIQASLLDDCLQAYQTVQEQPAEVWSPEHFEERFDCTPPKSLWIWFEYCKRQRRAITVLLDPEHGDVYFKTKLKAVLLKYINRMMDNDGMPHDALREHFVKIFLELHFLAAQTWLTAGEDDFLSVQEIINLLNTMRVGANYLNYRRLTTPDFDPEMGLREDPENEPARHIRP